MKQTLKTLLFLATSGAAAHAATAVADFNDLVPGDLNGQLGGTGFAATPWINNSAGVAETFIDVVAGDLTAPAGTNYNLAQSGTPQRAQNTAGTTSLQTRELATALTGDTVWFSFLLNQPSASAGSTAGSRGGINFNQPTTFSDPGNPRIVGLGSRLTAWLTANDQIIINDAFMANTTALVLGRIQVNDAGNDTLSLWVNPNVNALGAPTASFGAADWIGAAGITTTSVQSYGAGNGGIVDAFRISDDADAYTQVTGSTIPDPVFGVDPGSVATNYTFGGAYPGSTTRTVTFRNEGPNNSITVQNVSLTNNAGGVFTVDNVMPAVGSTLLPNETMSIRLAATSASGGDFTGELFIDTDVNLQDKTLPVTAAVFAPGEKVNSNPTFADALAPHWTAAAIVAPGIAPGSATMARVRGRGDKGLPLDEADSLGQAGSVPNGATNWELGCFFTPVRTADFESYTGAPADGAFVDRSFQLAIFTGDDLPVTSMTEVQALNALVQIAYLPVGNGNDPEGFYAFNGTSWTRLAGLPAIIGSADVDEDGLLEPGTDTINSYRLNIRGSAFGTGSASYSVTLSGGELAVPVTQSGIALSAGALITSAAPGSYTFTSSDISTLSNGASGLSTPFWVDDVFYYATALPEPSLTVAGNLTITGFNQSTPTGTVTLRNDGRVQNLNVIGITFGDPALSLVSPALPLNLAPGASAAVQVQLDSATLAPDTALLSTMTVASNDPAQPSAEVPVTATSTSSQNLLANWNFETSGADTAGNTDNFAFWSEILVRVRDVPGILPGSTTGVYLDSTGDTTATSQTLAAPVGDFDLDCGFAVRPTANRAFNLILSAGGPQINLRYQGSIWSAYDGTAWQPLIDMTSTPLATSTDTNFDGDFLDAGESFTAYRLHLTGTDWGTANPTYQIEILNAAGNPIAAGGSAFSIFQGVPTTAGLSSLTFTNQTDNNPGFWIDDVRLAAVTPATELKITAFAVNKTTGAISMTFTSFAGTNYSITASNDLGVIDDFSQVSTVTGSADTTTVNFTDAAVTSQPRRFYRVETP